MRPINVFEYEELARDRLHPALWDFYSAGANDEVTLRENRAAFERLQLRPRLLVDVSHIDLRTTLLGRPVAMPIGVAPAGPPHGAAREVGECATAEAAGAVDALMIARTESTRSMEEIAAAATGPLWFQLYFSSRTRKRAQWLVERAEAAGYQAIVVTVDSPRFGQKERSKRSEDWFDWPPAGNLINEPPADDGEEEQGGHNTAALTWADIEWLRASHPAADRTQRHPDGR